MGVWKARCDGCSDIFEDATQFGVEEQLAEHKRYYCKDVVKVVFGSTSSDINFPTSGTVTVSGTNHELDTYIKNAVHQMTIKILENLTNQLKAEIDICTCGRRFDQSPCTPSQCNFTEKELTNETKPEDLTIYGGGILTVDDNGRPKECKS